MNRTQRNYLSHVAAVLSYAFVPLLIVCEALLQVGMFIHRRLPK